jgi:uncharacterized membrane protein YtjA (UPF0391 family)
LGRAPVESGAFRHEDETMPAGNLLYYALVALVIALVAALFGFGGIVGAAAGIAQLVLCVLGYFPSRFGIALHGAR